MTVSTSTMMSKKYPLFLHMDVIQKLGMVCEILCKDHTSGKCEELSTEENDGV